MATERLPMRRIREILRLRRQQGLSVRETARALGVSVGVVSKTASRAEKAGVTWTVAEGMSDTALEERLYGRPVSPSDDRPRPDPVYLHAELRRPGVTLEVLHLEYLEQHPTGLRYTAFCDVYRRWLATASVTMRQVHKAGEKCFVDYSGRKASIVDPKTGERVEVELFVAVLGASNFTYARATMSQKVQDFVSAHVNAVTYFGGAPTMWVPHQLKSAVVVACRYEPGIQRTYADFARHYGSAVVSARPYKPRDKAKVEAAVLVAQRWILARLRNETFFSLEALNLRIGELLECLNDRPMKKLGGVSRRQLFERFERAALRPLPSTAYEYADWQSFGSASRRRWSRCFTWATESPRTGGASTTTSTRPIRRTCRKRIAGTRLGPTACCAGPSRSGLWRQRWCSVCSTSTRCASRAGGRREGCSARARSMAPSGPSRRAAPRCALARGRTSRSSDCWRSAARALA